MNLLSLRLDQKRKLKLRRYWYHTQDTRFGVIQAMASLAVVLILLWMAVK